MKSPLPTAGRHARYSLVLAFAMLGTISPPCLAGIGEQPTGITNVDRGIIAQMLKDVADTVRKNYYDPTLHGVDFNAAYQTANQAIQRAASVHEGYEAIASMLAPLEDSHTHFIPPAQPFTVDQGWGMEMIGDKCLVTYVTDGSDAATKGLKPGDQIVMVDGEKPSRDSWLNLQYQLRALCPRSSLHLVIASPRQQPRTLTVASKVSPRRANYDLTTNDIWVLYHQEQADWHRYEPRSVELPEVVVWKLPVFYLREADIDSAFWKAHKYPALILDLRGNPGGSLSVLTQIVGMLFDHDIKIADPIGRDKSKALLAKSQKDHAYKGKLIVLLDSQSASSSELLARVIQLEKRGIVIGDRSAGAVRQARIYSFVHGQMTRFAYGAEVTTADLAMADGQSLERIGVVPDEVLLPTPDELATGADPQLARALLLAGNSMSAEQAGKLFPVPRS